MSSAARAIRLTALLLLIAAVITGAALLLFTDSGRQMTQNPEKVGHDFQSWVHQHGKTAPLIFISIYVVLIVLMLPVWWLQILAGYGFGLIFGVLWSQIGSTIGAALAMLIARWIAGEWFHGSIETRLQKLKSLDDKLGHNGFLVVMAVRLMHFMPNGISNYAFGLTRITIVDVIVGTALGGIPAVAMYVGGGAGFRPWRNPQFLVVIAAINVVLLIPLLLRYLKPAWFQKYGIE